MKNIKILKYKNLKYKYLLISNKFIIYKHIDNKINIIIENNNKNILLKNIKLDGIKKFDNIIKFCVLRYYLRVQLNNNYNLVYNKESFKKINFNLGCNENITNFKEHSRLIELEINNDNLIFYNLKLLNKVNFKGIVNNVTDFYELKNFYKWEVNYEEFNIFSKNLKLIKFKFIKINDKINLFSEYSNFIVIILNYSLIFIYDLFLKPVLKYDKSNPILNYKIFPSYLKLYFKNKKYIYCDKQFNKYIFNKRFEITHEINYNNIKIFIFNHKYFTSSFSLSDKFKLKGLKIIKKISSLDKYINHIGFKINNNYNIINLNNFKKLNFKILKPYDKITYFYEFKNYLGIEINDYKYYIFNNKTLKQIIFKNLKKSDNITNFKEYKYFLSIKINHKYFCLYRKNNLKLIKLKNINQIINEKKYIILYRLINKFLEKTVIYNINTFNLNNFNYL